MKGAALHLNRAGKRPGWLSTERVPGSLGFGPKEVKGYTM
jgi:hypothetical protein